jgi:plastocyanin
MAAALPLAAETSKTVFYILAGALAAWAIALSALGLMRDRFPGSEGGARGVMTVTGVLVLGAVVAAVAPAATPEHVGKEALKPVKGIEAPRASTTPATPPPSGGGGGGAAKPAITVTASKTALAFDQKALTAKAGAVRIDFDNPAPTPHNVQVGTTGGKHVGGTKTVTGAKASAVIKLTPGTYTFYCSIPGHEQAGMKGTLTVK